MQNDWRRLRLVTRQFVICYSQDDEKEEEKEEAKARKHSRGFLFQRLWERKDYKCFYWFNKNEGLLHCYSFICFSSLCSCHKIKTKGFNVGWKKAKDYEWRFYLWDKNPKTFRGGGKRKSLKGNNEAHNFPFLVSYFLWRMQFVVCRDTALLH